MGKEPKISHPGKTLFPEAGLEKRDLADYYRRIAPMLLPYVSHRPLTLKSYPGGISQKGFYNKHTPDYFPDHIERIEVPAKKGRMHMSSADETRDLQYFAGQNVIEIHAALSTAQHLRRPDQLIFDLDPSDGDFEKVRRVAMAFKELLDERKLPGLVKTTGSRGIHIHIPLRQEAPFSRVKPLAKRLCEILNDRLPDLTTLEQRKSERGDRVFLDYLRNEFGQTAVVPYSVRARIGAPVATPVDWKELGRRQLEPDAYTMDNIFRRLGRKEDPWKSFRRRRITWKQLQSRAGS